MIEHKCEQGTPIWHKLRSLFFSGTGLKNLMGTPAAREKEIYKLVAARLTYGNLDENESGMQRGTRLEPEARLYFEAETGLDVREVGFCESEEIPGMGFSPDGLIGDNEALEIKNLSGDQYVKFCLDNEIPKDYVWQIVSYFATHSTCEVVHFALYFPEIIQHPMHVRKVYRNEMIGDIAKGKSAVNKAMEEADAIQQAFENRFPIQEENN